jgi:hypothetical protein
MFSSLDDTAKKQQNDHTGAERVKDILFPGFLLHYKLSSIVYW